MPYPSYFSLSPCPSGTPAIRRGMLAVPSRCSIFRAFRYFPINRKARERAWESVRSLACLLARSPVRSRANRNKKKHVYTYMQQTRGAHACKLKYTGTRKHTYMRDRVPILSRTRILTKLLTRKKAGTASGRVRRRTGRKGGSVERE